MNEIPMILEREAGLPPEAPAVGVGFFLNPIKDDAASEKAGRIMFKEEECVRIVIPGDKQTEVIKKATDRQKGADQIERTYIERFPNAYQAFKKRGEKPESGTPLEHWPMVTRSDVLNLKAFHIQTVEMLAGVNDANIAKLPFNARELREKAKQYVAQAAKSADAAAKDAVIADLQRQINELREKPRKAA